MNFDYYIEKEIPFVEKGRDENGFDCWGLVKVFYQKEMGLDIPDYTDCYSDTKDQKIAEKIISEKTIHWEKVETPQSGDVVLCRMRGRPMHVGIYKNGGYMLHIEEGNSAVLEPIENSKWKQRILGIYRLRD